MPLLLLQAAKLRSLADSCLFSYWDLPYCIPQQFYKTLYSHFPVGCLTAGLLRDDAKNPSLPMRLAMRRKISSLCSGERLEEFTTSNHKVIRELTLLTLQAI
jgi:hypothetical protein